MTISTIISIVKYGWMVISSGSFVYVVANEFRALKAAKAAGTPNKALLASAWAWLKNLFTPTKPVA